MKYGFEATTTLHAIALKNAKENELICHYWHSIHDNKLIRVYQFHLKSFMISCYGERLPLPLSFLRMLYIECRCCRILTHKYRDTAYNIAAQVSDVTYNHYKNSNK